MIIDVSHHNGVIDWLKVGKEIDFVILRCGYGSNIKTQDDVRFNENAHKCEKYGIPYGVYLYSYATSIKKVESEVSHVLRCINNRNVVLPLYYDIEESWICKNYNVKEFAELFIKRIHTHGLKCGIYSSDYLFKKHFDNIDMDSRWVARYSDKTPLSTYDIWQYTSSGKVNGCPTEVDLNKLYNNMYSDKFYSEIVNDVLMNKYGTGKTRKQLLMNKGVNYLKVQNMINTLFNM